MVETCCQRDQDSTGCQRRELCSCVLSVHVRCECKPLTLVLLDTTEWLQQSLLYSMPHATGLSAIAYQSSLFNTANTQQRGGDVAQLVEHRTSTPLTQVQFPSVARDFSPKANFSEDSLTVSVHPHVQSHAFTSVRTLKVPLSMSEFGGLRKY